MAGGGGLSLFPELFVLLTPQSFQAMSLSLAAGSALTFQICCHFPLLVSAGQVLRNTPIKQVYLFLV